MSEQYMECGNCDLQCHPDDWETYFIEVDYSNNTTGYDGKNDWYEETYTMRCKNCNHDTDFSSGWVVEPELDPSEHDDYE